MKEFVKKILSLVINLILYLFPRNPRIVLCTGWNGNRFADNSRYAYLYLLEHQVDLGLYKIVWLSTNVHIYKELKSEGFCVCMKRSLKSIYYHLRAKYFLYDQFACDYYLLLTQKAVLTNLWHGMPIKKFGLFNGIKWDLKDHNLLTCSEFGDKTLGKAFIVRPEKCLHGMYPRNYYLLHDIPFYTKEEMLYIKQLRSLKEQDKKIVFYLPTFRKKPLLFLGETQNSIIEEFLHFMVENNFVVVTKMHFAGYFWNNDSVKYSSDCLLNLPPDIDIYPFLKEVDILLTDYSSVLFDFLYLDKEIFCLPYDLIDYQSNDQGLLLDYDFLPVYIAYGIKELQQMFIKYLKGELESKSFERKKWLRMCFGEYTMDYTVKNILKDELLS